MAKCTECGIETGYPIQICSNCHTIEMMERDLFPERYLPKICFGQNTKCPIFADFERYNDPMYYYYPCDTCASWITYQTNHLDDVKDIYTEPLYPEKEELLIWIEPEPLSPSELRWRDLEAWLKSKSYLWDFMHFALIMENLQQYKDEGKTILEFKLDNNI